MTITCGIPQTPLRKPVADFEFVQPDSIEQALDILSDRGQETRVLAGGTDLVRLLKLGEVNPGLVLSIARLEELQKISPTADGGLSIGCLATMAEISTNKDVQKISPALAKAAGQLGSPLVRNRATIGGNFVNASPCADSAPPCAVLDAVVVLQSKSGKRKLALDEFMLGPGKTTKQADEMLVAIEIPNPGNNTGSDFQTLSRRKALEITIASSTARVTLDDAGTIKSARICLGSVAPTWLMSKGAQKVLEGQKPTDDLVQSACDAAVKDASPIDDLRAAAQYRRMMVEVLTRRALVGAIELAGGQR